MRSKRTDRRELKRSLAQLTAENAALRAQLPAAARGAYVAPQAKGAETAQTVPASAPAPVPALTAGGYPTRAAPLTAKTLKEAKEILMNSGDW